MRSNSYSLFFRIAGVGHTIHDLGKGTACYSPLSIRQLPRHLDITLDVGFFERRSI
jgi:hypothetical protein